MKLFPRTLLWRSFLLLGLLMLLSVAAWFLIFSTYEREPRARQIGQTLASVANLTRAALLAARPDARRGLLAELSDREGIHIYPSEPGETIEPLPDSPLLLLARERVREQLGPHTQMTLKRNGEDALFVSFRIDDAHDSEDADYWVALPRERLERRFPINWIGWGVAVLALSLAGAWLIVFWITRPLQDLRKAARQIGAGESPAPLRESGPEEIATVAQAFNHMNADLARLDQDRALILAGISHDLRTPLTRLRMGIEMGADETLREGMSADVDEMDKTISQFLDFARTEGGEALAPVDVDALLVDLRDLYAKRGQPVTLRPPGAVPPGLTFPARVSGRPLALRRAIANLLDNALRYAPGTAPELGWTRSSDSLCIDVCDRGPGIPVDEVERLKRPFTRLETARSNAVGAGLGLAIVERIARGHGGRFDLLPAEGGGLLARVTLPAHDHD